MDSKSEFGKGLALCLVKFAEHRWGWHEQEHLYEEMRKKHPGYFAVSNAVELHMNGASDHLYEIEVPEGWKNTKIDKMVKQLRHYGLDMGHGFAGKNWTEEDITKVYTLVQDIAIELDKKLGLKPDRGSW